MNGKNGDTPLRISEVANIFLGYIEIGLCWEAVLFLPLFFLGDYTTAKILGSVNYGVME